MNMRVPPSTTTSSAGAVSSTPPEGVHVISPEEARLQVGMGASTPQQPADPLRRPSSGVSLRGGGQATPAARTPVDPNALPNAATAKPANPHQSAWFPGSVTNSPTSHERLYVLVGGGGGWMYLEPGQSTAPGLDIDGVLHNGGFRKIPDGAEALVVDGDLRMPNRGFTFSGYGDWRPGAAPTDSRGRRVVSPGEIIDGQRDAFGFDAWFAAHVR